MSENLRQVMYIGRKPRKVDNVNEQPGRVWSGLGDIQTVTALEAIKLSKHDGIWTDVTEWPKERRIAKVNEIRERIRQEVRLHQPAPTLRAATTEELEAELRSRRAAEKVMPAITRAEAGDIAPLRPNEVLDDLTGEEISRPDSTEGVVNAIVGVIMQLDPGKAELFDAQGNPTQEAIEAELGYEISTSELQAAVREVGG